MRVSTSRSTCLSLLAVVSLVVTGVASGQATNPQPAFSVMSLDVFPPGDLVFSSIGDADGDGRNELIAASTDSGRVRIAKVASSGTTVITAFVPVA